MKAILVGLGSAGFGWYKRLRERGLLAAVVDTDPLHKAKMGSDPFPFYTSLDEALEREYADFLVNVTPPMAHTRVNLAAFDRKLPVLCEKPISFDYNESVEIVERSIRERIPFMVAENYRRFPYIRSLKKLLDSGTIGLVSAIDIAFYRYHQVKRNYTVSVLDDIGVHHFDLLRYLTGKEGTTVQAKLYNPIGGWVEPDAVINAYAFIELEGGVTASYTASIAARGTETPWCGNWRIEGTQGALELIDTTIFLVRDGRSECIDRLDGIDETDALAEFVASLREGREAETSGKDYLRTQTLVHYAKLASASGRTMNVMQPEMGGSPS
ncbi:oxidoreductase [Gordoniibacillus kamchatkensis]|uniref:Oxidoreductase n=1 Tax=Gordoniibacillus kamchatkensis TaxID=1590651 RepID=A0ABR5AIX9_9BACL|nr:Gfo/Idh/MocA family oxidoreductase [Paenibacillus sp. VKM B-2647]KIL40317.1 oxidoreductase [Paenibacillus sp. VKM B-2647]